MKTEIIKVTLVKVSGGFSPKKDNLNGKNEVMVVFNNGGLQYFYSLLSELGNNEIDNWVNIEKIRKSTSDKNRFNYIKKFENELKNLGVISKN